MQKYTEVIACRCKMQGRTLCMSDRLPSAALLSCSPPPTKMLSPRS